MTKPIKSSKNHTISNILTLIRTNPPFKSADLMVPAFKKQFGYSVDRSTISRHLKDNGISKVDGYYATASNPELTKKEELIRDLFKQSSLKLVSHYEVTFLSVDSTYADFICNQLKEHDVFKEHALGLIPYHNSIMIFCKHGSKEIIEQVITAYIG